MNKFLAATIGLGAMLAVSAPANAVPVESTWDFTALPTTYAGSSATFTSGDGKIIKASAYTNYSSIFASDFFPNSPSTLTLHGSGIGVKNSFFDNSQLDNSGFFDFIVLELPSADWTAVSMSFGSLGGNDDYDIWGSNALFGPMTQLASVEDDNPHIFAPGNQFQFLYVSGNDSNCIFCGGSNNDDFRIASFTGSVDVPEPATLALLGLGLAGIGAARRRRKVA